jgi:hypothetical protein
MSIATDMQAMADDLMRQFGVPATYKAGGAGEGVAVTVRCKPKQTIWDGSKRLRAMEISVRSAEVADPEYGDTFEIDDTEWKISGLSPDKSGIASHACGTLWQLALVVDARPGRK